MKSVVFDRDRVPVGALWGVLADSPNTVARVGGRFLFIRTPILATRVGVDTYLIEIVVGGRALNKMAVSRPAPPQTQNQESELVGCYRPQGYTKGGREKARSLFDGPLDRPILGASSKQKQLLRLVALGLAEPGLLWRIIRRKWVGSALSDPAELMAGVQRCLCLSGAVPVGARSPQLGFPSLKKREFSPDSASSAHFSNDVAEKPRSGPAPISHAHLCGVPSRAEFPDSQSRTFPVRWRPCRLDVCGEPGDG